MRYRTRLEIIEAIQWLGANYKIVEFWVSLT